MIRLCYSLEYHKRMMHLGNDQEPTLHEIQLNLNCLLRFLVNFEIPNWYQDIDVKYCNRSIF